jgi:RHS repeat-associated protein
MLVRSSTGKVGAGKLIKVMAGDRIHTSVQYYYPTVGAQPSGNGLNTLLGGLSSMISNSAGAGGLLKTASGALAQGVGLDPSVVSFFTQQNNNPQSGRPKAYLNILFFDEQFTMDTSASKYRQVGTGTMNPNNPGQIGFMSGDAALAKKSGYCYIYISNESDDLVYFDNFTLAHERSSLMEETHYYPFGLTMAGISSKAAGKGLDCGCGNKKGYNGNEIQAKEFSDGSGLDVYDFNARTYDQQIGRFIQIDPLAAEAGQDALTTYHFGFNNPIRYNDPTGECPICPFIPFIIKAFVAGAAVDAGTQVVTHKLQGQSWSESFNNVDLKQSAVSGTFSVLSAGGANFVGGTKAATVVTKAFVQTGLEAGESAANQYIQNKTVDGQQMLSDVLMDKAGGALTKNVNANGIKSAENQLDRAQRVVTGDPTSSGRQQKFTDAGNNLTTQQAKANGASAAVGSVLQETSNGVRNASGNSGKPTKPVQFQSLQKLLMPAMDNTRSVVLPPNLPIR